MNIALILFLTLIAILSCREHKIFWPGKYLFPAERILCSIWESTTFLTRMKCILVKNEVHSGIEHKILSAGNKYFPGLKILYSRQGSASINARNKIKAIFMVIQSILNHLIINVGVMHYKSRSKNSKMWKWKSEEDWLRIWRGLIEHLKNGEVA